MMNSGSTQSEGDEEEEFIIDDSNSEYSISSFFNPSSSASNTTSFHPHHTLLHNDHLFWSAGLTSHQTTTFPLPPPPPPDSDALRGLRKPPKKRSRVSNRNPTTVLTTDTTNFRQMVQQFTGIPATPLSAGPPNYPRSLDLALRPGYQYLDTLYGPVHPLKPSANKVSSSSSLLKNPTTIDSVVTSANIVSTTGDPAASASNNHPPSLSTDHHRFNLQNHTIIDPLHLGGNSSMGFAGAAALISGFQSPSPASQVKDNNHNI
ncbi:hypothetical protein ACP275_14G287200 [Erythranthe tilingii]